MPVPDPQRSYDDTNDTSDIRVEIARLKSQIEAIKSVGPAAPQGGGVNRLAIGMAAAGLILSLASLLRG